MPSLELGGQRVEYVVLRGKSRRHTYFRLKPDLTLEVVLPSGRAIDPREAILGRLPWVTRELERARGTRRVLTTDSLMFDGRVMNLTFQEGPKDSLLLDREGNEAVVESPDRRGIRELVRRLFLRESSAYVVKKVSEAAPLLLVKPKRVDVREIKMWGYCTKDSRLSFSWQLIALPERLREYIVFHELSHLVHFNHSAAFKRTLESVCPDFKAREKELDLIVPYEGLAPPR